MEFLSYNIIWKNKNSYTRKLRKSSELQVRIQLTSSSLDALTTELLEALRVTRGGHLREVPTVVI